MHVSAVYIDFCGRLIENQSAGVDQLKPADPIGKCASKIISGL